MPSVEMKISEPNEEGIGEIIAKAPNLMLGYYEDEEATQEVIKDGWFYTGDYGYIDKQGYVYITGRKKNTIVLKNGKNIFPEEMENLVNRIEGVKESFIFGKLNKEDKDDIKIYAKIVYDKDIVKTAYKVETDKEIYDAINKRIKEINKTMPPYKYIREISVTTEELIKTTTQKVKRHEEIKKVLGKQDL